MPRVVLTLAVVGLVVYALADLAGARRDETGGLPKWLWAVVILALPALGALVWIVMRRSTPRAPRRGARPIAPDDDPDFLRRLGNDHHQDPT
ncbi:PLD nuclease N-terminal domain-containing protein [Xylanimonas ulmi]|uniref:Phospholipase D-like protein n=1 Tax=Xylanimonas ulmi TaxID=228973 RepID=A0A4Q7M511_9MICO|nr:PLD nuclease N-terminal domain-containing protein [Xylanibacterium ulmi]RZS63046.1 phospholipase D-like protein [Xylanibacterium ulmi]